MRNERASALSDKRLPKPSMMDAVFGLGYSSSRGVKCFWIIRHAFHERDGQGGKQSDANYASDALTTIVVVL